jgi:phage terminase large subunit-like protein
MGEIEVGDALFDERGEVCMVTDITEHMVKHPCYEVEFSDGCKIVADGDHLWPVTELVDTYKNGVRVQYKEKIVATSYIAENLKSHGGRCNTFKIKVCGEINYVAKEFPIPPYTLGAWLGDGHSASAYLTCVDDEILESIKYDGISVEPIKQYEGKSPQYLLGRGTINHGFNEKGNSLQSKLRDLNLIKNKHIPEIYLQSSISQRMALLRGLMDTDGSCVKSGQCEFSTIRPALRDGFMELVRSLGLKPSCLTTTAKCNGKDCGPVYRIQFFAFDDFPVFTIKRKLERQKKKPSKLTRSYFRNIISVKEVIPRPVKCIAVDSQSNLYLAGEGFIPTHNTELAAALALYMLTADGEGAPQVFSAACDRKQASLIYEPACYMVRSNDALSSRCKVRPSHKAIYYPPNNGTYEVLSAETYTKHGLNPSAIFFDELHEQPDDGLWRVLTAGTDYARQQQLIFVITTAGIWDVNSIWWRIRSKAIQIANGTIKQDDFLPVLFLADPEKDKPEDEAVWIRNNPSIGQIFTLAKIRADYAKAKDDSVEFQDFCRFRLNIPIKSIRRWMPMEDWDKCGGMVDLKALEGKTCYGGLDMSTKVDLTALCMVFPPQFDLEKWTVLMKFYCPEDSILQRSRSDRVHYDVWQKEGWLTATPGNVIDEAFIEKDVIELSQRYNVGAIGYDPWGATGIATRLFNDYDVTMVEMRQGAKTLSEPAKDILVRVKRHEVNHGNNPVLRWCADNLVMVTDANENVRPDKEKATDRIDGVVAMIMAWGRAIFAEPQYDEPRITVIGGRDE